MNSVFRFEHLKETALKNYVERHDDLARKLKYGADFTAADLKQMVDNRSDEIVLDHFMFGGVDLKGRLQYAYISQGTRLSLNLSVNPLGIIGLNTKLTAEASGDKEAKRSVVLYRCMSSAATWGATYQVVRPVMLHSFVGQRLSFKGSLGAELSLGWEATVGGELKQEESDAGEGSSPVKPEVTPEAGPLARKMEYDTKLETFAVGFEAKVGVKAAGTFEYSTYYAEDPNPCDYAQTASDYVNKDRGTHLRKDLTHILREGSSKTMYKYLACDLINKNLALFGLGKRGLDEISEDQTVNEKTALLDKSPQGVELHRKILWHVTTLSMRKVFARLIRVLQENRQTADPATAGVLQDVRRVMAELEYFLRPGDKEEAKIGVVSYIVRTPSLESATREPTLENRVKLVVNDAGEVKTASKDLMAFLREVQFRREFSPMRDKLVSLMWSLDPYVDEDVSEGGRVAAEMAKTFPKFKVKDQSDKSPGALFQELCAAWDVCVRENQPAQREKVKELIQRIPRHEAPCSLRIISDSEGGEARAFATAGAEVKLPGASAELAAEISAGISGGSKTATARFQTSCLAVKKGAPNDPPTRIYTTYDTSIRYSHLIFDRKLQVAAKGAVLGKGGEWTPEDLNRQKETPLCNSLNRMRYRCAVAVWTPPEWSTWGAPTEVEPFSGSGVVFGESVSVENLRGVYTRLDEDYTFPPDIKYLVVIAKTLHVDVSVLVDFLNKAEVRSVIEGHSMGTVEGSKEKISVRRSSSLFIEAAFKVPSALTESVRLQCGERNVAGRRMITLQDDMAAPFFRAVENADHLLRNFPDSLRLRYRRTDFDEKSRTLFPLGFNIAGTSFGLKLENVEKAGSDAIVELVSWYPTSAAGSNPSQRDAYEAAVPPAVLFAQ